MRCGRSCSTKAAPGAAISAAADLANPADSPFGTRRTISRTTCRARARFFLRQRPASSSLRPPSQNPPRSSPLALAWGLKHRAHPSLEDFLGKRTPRCIGQESRWKPSRIGAGRFVRHQVSAGHRTGPDALGQTVRTLQLGL